ncbi:MAG: hypothetical protein ABIZ80_13410 [Bryobacteraceae bacterium]
MRIHKNVVSAITAIGLFTMGAAPACYATVVQFNNDRSGWVAASSNVTTIDFSSLTAAPDFAFQTSITTSGFTFASYYNTNVASNNVLIKNNEPWGTGNYLLGPAQDQFGLYTLKITFANPVTSFGSDIMYNGNYQSTFQVTLSTAEVLTTTTTMPDYTSRAFFGFTSDTPVSYLVFKPTYVFSTEPRIVLDNVSFGDAGGATTETPEAATLLLCAAGLLLLNALRRRTPMLVPAN